MSLRKKQSSTSSKKSPRPTSTASSQPPATSDSPAPKAALPDDVKTKLNDMFVLIEREFEALYSENVALKEKVDSLSDRLDVLVSEQRSHNLETTHPPCTSGGGGLTPATSTTSTILGVSDKSSHHLTTPLRKKRSSGTNITKKLLPGPKKSSSAIKIQHPECNYVSTYYGHKDGIWDVAYSRNVLGTASADGTACVWDANSGQVHVKYTGHAGSVNSIAFHPTDSLTATASGDGSAHLWKYTTDKESNRDLMNDSNGVSDEEGEINLVVTSDNVSIKTPLISLQEHSGPVMSCDWLCDGDQLVTASWDHSALLWDAHTGKQIHTLTGHDDQLSHVSTHPTQKLLVTSSQDTTFRLWDFRAPLIHSVNVFQGHSKGVSSAVFSLKENVISASDDHTVKIWDLHKMRYPIASIRLDYGVNRISVSHDHHVLALPLDNGQIRLYDLGGNRLAVLPNRNRKGHVRMVHSVCWSHDKHVTSSSPAKCNLFSVGFDSRIIGWRVHH